MILKKILLMKPGNTHTHTHRCIYIYCMINIKNIYLENILWLSTETFALYHCINRLKEKTNVVTSTMAENYLLKYSRHNSFSQVDKNSF